VCAYADVGGLTLKGSSKALSSIPSTLPVPIGEGGTGMTTVAEARGALSDAIKGLMVVNQAYPAGAPEKGTEACPYKSIQAALNAIGPAANAAEELQAWEVRIASGFYDEDLQIPDLRTIHLNAGGGGCLLSNTTLTNLRTIVLDSAAAPASPFPKALTITNMAMIAPLSLTQGVGITTQYEVHLKDVSWIGAPATVCVDATAWDTGGELRLFAYRCSFQTSSGVAIESNTGHPGADVFISRLDSCEVDGSIQVAGYSQFKSTRFDSGMNFTNAGGATQGNNLPRPSGFFDCEFDGAAMTISAQQAGDFVVDDVSWKSWEQGGGHSFGGGGAFQANPVSSISDPFFDTSNGAVWAPGGSNSTKAAIARIADVVSGLHGAIPI
jgi:hypothetical protein